jgi:predicted CoA-binding protein
VTDQTPHRTIAILGASRDRRKFGNKGVRAYQADGWRVLPVNLREDEIEGLPVYRSLGEARAAAGETLDRISVYLPPETTRELLPEIAAAAAAETFFNPGAANPGALREAAARGIVVRDACSIVDIGLSPSQFP